jgi:hypothetical protein
METDLGGDFEELDAAMTATQAARAHHRADESAITAAHATFRGRFRDWAENVAAPTLEAVADHARGLHEDCATHVHHPDRGAGHRESVDLNVRLMGEYVQLTFRPRADESLVGISENHGDETTERLEDLGEDQVRRRAVTLVTQAIVRAGQV